MIKYYKLWLKSRNVINRMSQRLVGSSTPNLPIFPLETLVNGEAPPAITPDVREQKQIKCLGAAGAGLSRHVGPSNSSFLEHIPTVERVIFVEFVTLLFYLLTFTMYENR